MDREDKKVRIKLERHQWPDEIEKERKQRRVTVLVVGAILLSFSMGWFISGLFNSPRINPLQTNSDLERFERVYRDVLNKWYFTDEMEDSSQTLIDNAIIGMLEENGDIHSNFMTRDEMAQLLNAIDLDFEGIGVGYATFEGANIITRIYKGSPAEKAGIKLGDIIQSVNGEDITEVESQDLKELITGAEGTDVTVGVLRTGETLEFTMQRAPINALTWGEVVAGDVGYLEISSFGNELGDGVKSYLDEYQAQGISKLIIDLRDNGGGYLSAVNDLSSFFFDDGDLIYKEQFADGSQEEYKVKDSARDHYKFDKIVLLLNDNSASASEVFALAMKEKHNVDIVGTKSYGKGTVQTTYSYPDQTALKLTVAKWFSPQGNNIHGVGIEPDFEVRLPDIFYSDYQGLAEGEVIHYDEVNDGVAYVQKILSYLKYTDGRTDGYYDAKTRDALLAFKRDHNVAVDDTINEESMKALYQAFLLDWSQNKKDRDMQLLKAIEVVRNV